MKRKTHIVTGKKKTVKERASNPLAKLRRDTEFGSFLQGKMGSKIAGMMKKMGYDAVRVSDINRNPPDATEKC